MLLKPFNNILQKRQTSVYFISKHFVKLLLYLVIQDTIKGLLHYNMSR